MMILLHRILLQSHATFVSHYLDQFILCLLRHESIQSKRVFWNHRHRGVEVAEIFFFQILEMQSFDEQENEYFPKFLNAYPDYLPSLPCVLWRVDHPNFN